MDGLLPNFPLLPGAYILAPVHGQGINMDAFQVIIFPIPVSYDQAKDDSIGKFVAFAYDHLKNNGQVTPLSSCSK
jgi:hypothetical protein